MNIMCSQTCFYMAYRNLKIEAGQCCCKGGRCVPMDKNDIWIYTFKNSTDIQQNIRSDIE